MTQLRLFALVLVTIVAAVSWALTCGAWQLEREVARVGPLTPRHFARLTLVTAGTGGAYENPERRGPASAVGYGDEVILVDAGRGVAEALRLAGIPVSQPSTVYLTNLLPENTVGLDDLLLTGWLNGRGAPLRVVGPPGTRALAEGLAAGHAGAIEARAEALGLPTAGARADVLEIEAGFEERRGDLEVRAGALPGGPLEAFAYRFEAAGRSAVVAGTGWAPDALTEFASGAHLLAHEAVYVPDPEQAAQLGLGEAEIERLRREAALHTSIDTVGHLAHRAAVETLVLVRLRPPPVLDLQLTGRVDDAFSGRILIPSDGDEVHP